MDVYNAKTRSAVMRAVKSKNTKPEIKVRQLLHRAGYRYRLHRKDLPGKPDLVFPGRGAVIFVHGCFWHQHKGCHQAERPSSNIEYWDKKLNRNLERDRQNVRALRKLGWKVFTLWECQITRSDIFETLQAFLDSPA